MRTVFSDGLKFGFSDILEFGVGGDGCQDSDIPSLVELKSTGVVCKQISSGIKFF